MPDSLSLGMRTLIFCLFISSISSAQRPVYTTTKTYAEVIQEYKSLDKSNDIMFIQEFPTTDAGYPLHTIVLSREMDFSPWDAANSSRCVIMINNAIHPGEPDGVDASIQLTRQYLAHPDQLPKNVVLVIIPIYNIDGYLNR